MIDGQDCVTIKWRDNPDEASGYFIAPAAAF
jgi:hypothetical protein